MIERLRESIYEYFYEFTNPSVSIDSLAVIENDAFTINGNKLDNMAGITNERIKISETFTHYIIEKCDPKHVNILRRFVEDYERQVELAKNDMFSYDALEQLKEVTVTIDLLFGIDVSYCTKLHQMFMEGKESSIIEYFSENIDHELSYYDLCTALNKGGFRR